MYRDKTIAVTAMALNEERLVGATLESVPDFVDRVYFVDDGSTDRTLAIAREIAARDPRIHVVQHERNLGVGQSIITGYRLSAADGNDITVVVGGDHQMPMEQIPELVDPIIDGEADYTKGNRFLMPNEGLDDMPWTRMLPNAVISFLTKIASGYYKVFDVVDGFTAITKRAIELVDWDEAWTRYGYPMDFLIRLNAYGLKVKDVPRRAIYLEGERQSQIKGFPYAIKCSYMLARGFVWRLFTRYLYRDFHPLLFFYLFGLLLFPLGLATGCWLLYQQWTGIGVSGPRSVLCALMILMGLQSLFFAVLYDMEESR